MTEMQMMQQIVDELKQLNKNFEILNSILFKKEL